MDKVVMNRRYATADENPVLRSRYAQQRKVELDWCCEPAIKCDPDAPQAPPSVQQFWAEGELMRKKSKMGIDKGEKQSGRG
jgi:hypothetical protein